MLFPAFYITGRVLRGFRLFFVWSILLVFKVLSMSAKGGVAVFSALSAQRSINSYRRMSQSRHGRRGPYRRR